MGSWSQKKVVVAGGSQGIGFEIARAFAQRGAHVRLLARNLENLKAACQKLADEGHVCSYQLCDATQWDSVVSAFQEIDSEFGSIDVLVNAVGKSTRANIEDLDLAEAREMMDVNYFSALHCIKAALPALKSNQGHIVNIGSLSSKTAWPFMTPYTASKFALAALTHQLRIELGKQVHAMLVCPGPIKRDDSGQRYQDQADGLPDTAKNPGGGAKLKGVCPIRLADKVVRGCEKRKSEIIMPWKSKLLFIFSAISTRIGDWLISKNMKS